jgi:polyphosphate glucokinase
MTSGCRPWAAIGAAKCYFWAWEGLGTGLGSAMIVEGIVAPMEIAHLPYKHGTYEDYVGRTGLERDGEKKWRRHVADFVARLIAALQPDDTVIGGGNVKKLEALRPGSRPGDNANAFRGGFRLWAKGSVVPADLPHRRARSVRRTRTTGTVAQITS